MHTRPIVRCAPAAFVRLASFRLLSFCLAGLFVQAGAQAQLKTPESPAASAAASLAPASLFSRGGGDRPRWSSSSRFSPDDEDEAPRCAPPGAPSRAPPARTYWERRERYSESGSGGGGGGVLGLRGREYEIYLSVDALASAGDAAEAARAIAVWARAHAGDLFVPVQ